MEREILVLSAKGPFDAFFKRIEVSLRLHCFVAPEVCFDLAFVILLENNSNLSLFWNFSAVPEIKMSQLKILENLRLPLRSLNVASEILLVGRSMGGTIRQVAETALPRSSGRPPPLLVVQAPKRFWAVEGFILTLSSFERKKEVSPIPLSLLLI